MYHEKIGGVCRVAHDRFSEVGYYTDDACPVCCLDAVRAEAEQLRARVERLEIDKAAVLKSGAENWEARVNAGLELDAARTRIETLTRVLQRIAFHGLTDKQKRDEARAALGEE